MMRGNAALISLLLALGGCGDGASAKAPEGDGGSATPSRMLALDGVFNARDMGGYPTADGRTVKWRTLMHSGDLSKMSAAGCEAYAALGIATVVDLREPGEVAAAPDVACAQQGYHQVALAKLLPPNVDNYLLLLSRSGPAIAQVFDLLSRPGALPALHHCVIGRDRSAVVAALILLALGVDGPHVVDEFLLGNRAGTDVEAAWIQAVIDEVARQGGIETYLERLGVDGAKLRALREAALT